MQDDYSEDWNLPDGRALRVIGRPHPSGTVVLLFDDVTTSLNMEREFRSEISCLKSAINASTIGLILFGRCGKVHLINQAFKDAFSSNNACKTIQDFSKIMQGACVPSPVWGDLRDYVENESERSQWLADVKLQTEETMVMHVEPLENGETLCEFHFAPKLNHTADVSLTCAAQ
jgi:PAS domain-containing protein